MLRTFRRILVSGVAATALILPLAPTPASAVSVGGAVELTGHSYGATVDASDVAAAMRRIGMNYGTTVDSVDVQQLLDWARPVRRLVDTALAQVGKRYQWGAAGPNAFDCSGLTSYAYRAAGVSIPRTSTAQARATASVSPRDIRPGDLVFFGRPVGHVAVYIGDGEFVESPNSGNRVRVRDDLLQRRNLVKVGRFL